MAFGEIPRPLADVPILYPTGQKLSVKTKYRGKVCVIVLIATTCNSCKAMVDQLAKLQKQFGPRGMVAVGAVVDEQNAKYTVGPWVARYRPAFEFGYLEKPEFIKLADIPANMRPFVPVVLFVDKKGKVRFQAYGDDAVMKQTEKAFPAIIDGLLKDQEGPMSTTKQVDAAGKELPAKK